MATNAVSMNAMGGDHPVHIAHGPDNPQPKSAQEQEQSIQFPDGYKDKIIETIKSYRNGWAPDRLLRIPNWMRNVLMFRGSQLLGWDPSSNTYFDALAWYRTEGRKDSDGDDTYLEKYANNITSMLESGFVGTMSRGIPPTLVRPENAEVLADVTTAKAAQEAISIIERMNRIRSLVRIENNLLYLYGCYFKYTRAVMDGNWAGWDYEDVFGSVSVAKPDRYHCFRCGKDTPATDFDQDDNRSCPGCHTALGDEAFYPAEQSDQVAMTGQKRVARAGVKWSAHGPMEVDVDPMAKTLDDTPLLAFDQEVDIGALRLTFPGMFAQIKEGAEVATTANASYEKLRRNEIYSMGWGYTSDSSNQKPTFSQNWLQPIAYGRLADQAFSDWMQQTFPDGLKISLVGETIVDIREANLTKEWSVCLLHENVGMYPQSIADNVVPYNIRFNDTMDEIDDWIQRCAAGMTIYDQSKIDRREMAGRVMSPGVFNGVQTKNAGIDKPLAESIMQFEFRLDPQIFTYPGMLLNFCELISGVTPQTFGGGTQDGIETFGGQKQAVDMALTKLNIFWENLKEEHAAASQNALECLQKLMKAGAVSEMVDVIEANGSEFRNNYVNWSRMSGHIKVYPDIDQGLPQSPEQIRQTMMQIVEMASKNNPIATAIMDVVPNQESFKALCGTPDMVLPNSAQRARTLQAINTLMENDYIPGADAQGNMQPQLPVLPEKRVENFKVARETMQLFWQENGDYAKSNPAGWQRTMEYYDALVAMEAQAAGEEAQRQMKVKMMGSPPPPQPDPQQQQALSVILQDAAQEVQRLQQLSALPPLGQNGSIAGQVTAAGKIVDAALKAQAAANKE
jgi:hypothetical protein